MREARTEPELSQERLAEILNIDSRTILNIEAERGNPKFEKLYPLITYLKIPAGKIFDPAYKDESPNLQKLLSLQRDCTEQEAADLIPMFRYLLSLLLK
ncbi:helix-turn-helix transcriptional regulator [Lachnospiraceae bacterium 29-84]